MLHAGDGRRQQIGLVDRLRGVEVGIELGGDGGGPGHLQI